MNMDTKHETRSASPLSVVGSAPDAAPRLVHRPSPAEVVVDGVPFAAWTELEVVQHVMAALGRGEGGALHTPNVDILRQLRRPELAEVVRGVDLIVPDGMPIVWASRLRGTPLPERVAGSSLFWSLSRAAVGAERSVFLLGGGEGTAQRAAERLSTEVPGLQVAGWHFPPFGFERRPDELADVEHAVLEAKPDIVFVALGFPKQERLALRLRSSLPGAWFVGCGGTLAMAAGQVSRAPQWVQRTGLEWAYRLAQEPRRLARRYLVDDVPYALGLLARSAATRSRGGAGEPA